MQHASQAIERPGKLCPTPSPATADKWQILGDLTRAAGEFGLTHRTLGVLKALLTFLPDKTISTGRPSIVFPSNRTLADRLNGIPESTLRRHLATLVKSGLVTRRDSPNRKRYARRAGADGIAFGFDLTPLAQMADQIATAAKRAHDRAQRHALLRARLMDLIQHQPAHQLVDTARKALRRRNNSAELEDLITSFPADNADQMSGTDSQIEHHIQVTEKKDSVDFKAPQLDQIKHACPTVQEFYPGSLDSWSHAHRASRQVAPMMGIENAVITEAERQMGIPGAVTTVLTMLERLATLKNPGGYLRKLTHLAKQGRYDPNSALSLANCHLTT